MNHIWVQLKPTSVAADAVFGGYQSDGAVAYVGRVTYHGHSLPANVVPSKNRAHACYNGREIYDTQYEVLTGGRYAWVPCPEGKLPPNCVLIGDAPVGRGHWIRSLVVGRIDAAEHCLYIPFADIEHRLDTFEALTHVKSKGDGRDRFPEVNQQQQRLMEIWGTEKESPSKWAPCTKQSSKAVLISDDCWVKLDSLSTVPPDAVVCGHDPNGAITYVGRAFHEGLKRPAKVVPSSRCAFVPSGQGEFQKNRYEVLTGNHFKWLPGAKGSVPPSAVIAGMRNEEENFYIGRAGWKGGLCFGKIVPSMEKILFPLNANAHSSDSYEVLCYSLPEGGTQSQRSRCHHNSTWVSSKGGSMPENAVHLDAGTRIYVGRAVHNEETHPAAVVASKAHLTYGGRKWEKPEFEVLTGEGYCWVPDEGGRVPPCAVEGGQTDKKEPLYIGRTLHSGAMTMGKVQQSNGCMFIAVGDEEVSVKSYEVLVHGAPLE